MCQRGLRANVPNASQLFIFASQRAKKHTNVPKVCQLFNFACQLAEGMPIFQLRLPKGVPIFQLFFKRIFQFFNFLIMLNICKFQEHLGSSRKLISRNKDFKFWHLKNIFNLKPLTSFWIEHVGLTKQFFGQCKMELNIFFYLPNFICRVWKGQFRKAYVMHTINLAVKAYIM